MKPKSSWPKGVSGFPQGRLRDMVMSDSLRIQIRRVVVYKTDPKNKKAGPRILAGLPAKHTFADLVTHRLIRAALDGDISAIREVFNRLEGSPDATLTVVPDQRAPEEPLSVQAFTDWLRGALALDAPKDESAPRVH